MVRHHHQAGDPPRLFQSLAQLVNRIGAYIEHWNEEAKPFEWTATADSILDKLAMLDRDYKKLVANNLK